MSLCEHPCWVTVCSTAPERGDTEIWVLGTHPGERSGCHPNKCNGIWIIVVPRRKCAEAAARASPKIVRWTREILLHSEESMTPLNHNHTSLFTSTHPCKSETYVAFLLGLAGFAGPSVCRESHRTSHHYYLLQERCPKRETNKGSFRTTVTTAPWADEHGAQWD